MALYNTSMYLHSLHIIWTYIDKNHGNQLNNKILKLATSNRLKMTEEVIYIDLYIYICFINKIIIGQSKQL